MTSSRVAQNVLLALLPPLFRTELDRRKEMIKKSLCTSELMIHRSVNDRLHVSQVFVEFDSLKVLR